MKLIRLSFPRKPESTLSSHCDRFLDSAELNKSNFTTEVTENTEEASLLAQSPLEERVSSLFSPSVSSVSSVVNAVENIKAEPPIPR